LDFLWRISYNIIVVPLFYLFARIYALFNSKARETLRGRKGMFDRIAETDQSAPVIWFHCSSAGEFEQAKPIIAILKNTMDGVRIVVSFFSPSGYSAGLKYDQADLVCYLPFDTTGNARRMFQLIRPSILIFMGYDVWPNHVWAAASRHVPVILADALVHEGSKRLWPIVRSFLKSVHKHINVHCAISESDAQRLRRICPRDANIQITGDTRFDQVIARRGFAGKKLEGLLPEFDKPVIIAGSTYIEDERVILDAYQNVLERWGAVQLILVPHEPKPHRLAEIDALMTQRNLPYGLLSEIAAELNDDAIVVDRVGVLAELYMLSDIAFIGGSFHARVHNVMEPAAMGKPVLFGTMIQNSQEAMMLLERGAGIMVKDSEEMTTELIRLLSDENLRESIGNTARTMIEESAGATEKIVSYIDKFLGCFVFRHD
jgi:3-deoxy-D-manno-octulosonic-acid transferase